MKANLDKRATEQVRERNKCHQANNLAGASEHRNIWSQRGDLQGSPVAATSPSEGLCDKESE